MNNRNLLIIFIVIAIIYGLTQTFAGKKETSFKTELIQVDTSAITSITIKPKGEEAEISLTRESDKWIVSNGVLNETATNTSVNGLLSNLILIKTNRIASKTADKWTDFEVDESNGIRVKVLDGKKVVEDFIVGRFNFNQQSRSATSFVRLANGDEVYAVDGFLSMTFGQNFDSFRDKTLVEIPGAAEITELSLNYGPNSELTPLQLIKNNGQWLLNNEIPLDSTKVENYINGFKNVLGSTFADDFDEVQSKQFLEKSLTVNGNNILEQVQVQCFVDTTRIEPFVLKSNQNNAYFNSDSAGVYNKLFKDWNELIATEE